MMPKKPLIDPESCASCKCFLPNDKDEFGYCRKAPPTVVVHEESILYIQPSTSASDWCGGFVRLLHS